MSAPGSRVREDGAGSRLRAAPGVHSWALAPLQNLCAVAVFGDVNEPHRFTRT